MFRYVPCDSTEQKQKRARHVQSHHVNHPSRPNSIAQMAVAATSICTGAVLLPCIIRKHPLSISRLFLVVFFNYRLNRRQKKDKMKKKEGESGKTSRNSMPKRGAFCRKDIQCSNTLISKAKLLSQTSNGVF